MLDAQWRKSTRSNPSGNCLQARWTKSNRSSAGGNNCLEAQLAGNVVQVRDSKLGDASPILEFTADEWRAAIGGFQDGDFDLPE